MIRSRIKFRPFQHPDAAWAGHLERGLAILGGGLGVAIVSGITHVFLTGPEQALLIGSMGASAVLLFAVPHGPLSQPWPVLGGHILSAFVGVMVAGLLGSGLWAAAVAVGLAIGIMYYTSSIHPPGGATALTAVIGGPAVQDMGWQFVLTPVAINALCIVVVAIAYNGLFAWRRYPLAWYKAELQAQHEAQPKDKRPNFELSDLEEAVQKLGTFIDISEPELMEIFDLATQTAEQKRKMSADQIHLGRCYTNGAFGPKWAVRQIIDEQRSLYGHQDVVIYKTVAGDQRRTSKMVDRAEFANWACYEVMRNENSWHRVTLKESDAGSETTPSVISDPV